MNKNVLFTTIVAIIFIFLFGCATTITKEHKEWWDKESCKTRHVVLIDMDRQELEKICCLISCSPFTDLIKNRFAQQRIYTSGNYYTIYWEARRIAPDIDLMLTAIYRNGEMVYLSNQKLCVDFEEARKFLIEKGAAR
jgi:hypothetical protein